jgi:crotonobetainyl-CoA:carnitine CoA-transferase CaiB-like acyl-CoA transferase
MPEPGILTGTFVVDASQGLAGPVATRLLAEAGAEVIKVEPPGGDRARRMHPTAFASWNRSKKGLVLDMDQPDDRRHLEEMLAGADVFVHEFTPVRAQALGLDPGTLGSRWPSLVTATVTGFPYDHPDVDMPHDELLVQARLGMQYELDARRDGPAFIALPAGILARLLVVARTGRGGTVHTSLAQGLFANLTMLWNRAERPDPALGPDVIRALEWTSGNQCADGEWVVQGMADIPAMRQALDSLDPPGQYGVLADMQRALRTRPAAEWVELFGRAEQQCMEILRPGECLRYPQTVANGYVTRMVDPLHGDTVQPGPPYSIQPPSRATGPAPALDQDRGLRLEPRVVRAPDGPFEPYPGKWPLEHLRVLDLGMFLAGPFAPQCLADMGADVIKLEPPGGDRMRAARQLFSGCQRNKRSIAIDLKDPRSRPVLERLVRWADVVHHNLRRPAAVALGVDRESIQKINPQAVFCHTSTYGPEGAMADWPGVDHDGVAASGWMWDGAGAGNPPFWYPIGWSDFQCALSSLVATLLAVYRKTATGAPSAVTTSILGAASHTTNRMILADGTISPAVGVDAAMTGTGPGYRLYQCSDEWIAVAADYNDSGARLAALLGEDDSYTVWSRRPAGEVLSELVEVGVPAVVVARDHRLPYFDDPTLRRLRYTVSYDHPEYGRFEQPGAYWTFGDLEARLDSAPPTIGQHSHEILAELELSAEEAAGLIRDGVVIGPSR